MELYKLKAEWIEALESAIDTETGELKDMEAYEKFDAISCELDEKLESVSLYIKNVLAEAAAVREEKLKLGDRQAKLERKAESLKRYLMNNMVDDKFSTPKVQVSFRKSEQTIIDDINMIPVEYIKFGDPTADKTRIRQALKNGSIITGAHLEENRNIIIK